MFFYNVVSDINLQKALQHCVRLFIYRQNSNLLCDGYMDYMDPPLLVGLMDISPSVCKESPVISHSKN